MPSKPGGKPGGEKYYTVDEFWNHFLAYRKYAKSNPLKVVDWVGGMGKMVTRKKERPLSMEGFENYMFEKHKVYVDNYIKNKGDAYGDYIGTVATIRKIIRQDQIDGGMAGIYTPSITQRLNNLVERTENKHEVTEIIIKEE